MKNIFLPVDFLENFDKAVEQKRFKCISFLQVGFRTKNITETEFNSMEQG
ncbi:hypothetical protein [Daejeonella sp.]|nr:hypothetical protein [Daejeonella sp.]HQT23625.1 hypothetical protein [Daejeonella sp.]HQT56918.1 hypothetical protein [Daejeonella sp.]